MFYRCTNVEQVEILRNNGYDVEVHDATTEDGYVLELHRIPRSKSGQDPVKNHPVFLHHGIFGSSADWVLAGANMSLREYNISTRSVNRSTNISLRCVRNQIFSRYTYTCVQLCNSPTMGTTCGWRIVAVTLIVKVTCRWPSEKTIFGISGKTTTRRFKTVSNLFRVHCVIRFSGRHFIDMSVRPTV